MKIKYTFDNGETIEVEVSEEIGSAYMEFNRREEAANKKEHRHCYSLDAIDYEGIEYGAPDFTEELYDDREERDTRVRAAFSHLSSIQQRRIQLLADGLSIREIAKREGKNYRTVYDSIEAAKKKFLKFF